MNRLQGAREIVLVEWERAAGNGIRGRMPKEVSAHALIECGSIGIGQDGHAPRTLFARENDGGVEQCSTGTAADPRRLNVAALSVMNVAS